MYREVSRIFHRDISMSRRNSRLDTLKVFIWHRKCASVLLSKTHCPLTHFPCRPQSETMLRAEPSAIRTWLKGFGRGFIERLAFFDTDYTWLRLLDSICLRNTRILPDIPLRMNTKLMAICSFRCIASLHKWSLEDIRTHRTQGDIWTCY